MKRLALFTFSFFILSGLSYLTAAKKCDQDCLIDLMNRYLAALAKHDPSGVPLAANVQFVENTEKIPVGKGLWETASGGPDAFKLYVPDPTAGQVGFIGIIKEQNKPVMLGARLKIENGKITEIDHLVVHELDQGNLPNLQKPRPGLLQTLKPSERSPREQMFIIANSYYEAIVQNNGKFAPFADECQRRENGGTSANDQEEPRPDDDFAVYRKMKCGEQLSTGVMRYITKIDRRRLIAADPETGLVFAYSMFVHNGEPKIMKIVGVPGITERPNKYGPFNLPACHIFKIRNGKIYEIEAMGYMAKYGIKNGWE